MDWFLAAATGRDARRDALLGQRPTDFVATASLIPHHRGRRRQVFEHHIDTGEVTALPLTQVESQGTTFAVTDHMELAGHAPLGATNQARGTLLVETGRRGMGFDISGVKSSAPLALGHQAALRSRVALRHWMLTTRKRSAQKHVSPAAATVVDGFVGTIGRPGHPPSAAPSE